MGALLGSLTAIAIGISDMFGRRVTGASSPISAAGVMQLVAALTTLGSAMFVTSELIWGDVVLGAFSGLGMGGGLACYFAGLQRSSSAVVAPVVATLSAVVPYVYTLATGTEPSSVALLGAVVALAGLLLVTVGGRSPDRVRAGLLWGVASGLSYGIGLTVVIETTSDSGAWPGFSQRTVAFVMMVVIARGVGLQLVPPAGVRWAALAAGALAGLTTIFYIAGVQADPQPAVVTAGLFPIASVTGGWLIYRDEVSQVQVAGIAAALAGVVGVVVG